MAGREEMKGGESFPDAIGPQGLVSLSPEVRVQGQKSPQVERRMASAPIARRASAARRTLKTKRRSALHPLTFEGSPSRGGRPDEGLPGADSKNTGDGACL